MRHDAVRASARTVISRGLPVLTAMAALALTACGGGGDGGSAPVAAANPPAAQTPATPQLVTGLIQGCSAGVTCGAATASSYSGTGTGLWGRTNDSTAAVDMQYSITGLSAGKTVSLMLTNLTSAAVTMPATVSSNVVADMVSPQALSVQAGAETTMRAIGEFNRAGWVDVANAGGQPMLNTMGVPAPQMSTAGMPLLTQKNWNDLNGSPRSATLRQQYTATDGKIINFWVEDAEYPSHVTDAMVTALANAFAVPGPNSIYQNLVSIGGPVWGPSSAPGLLPDGQPVDIVILNITPDGKAYGTVGYFWALNNILKTSSSKAANSNEAVSLYLDSETLQFGGSDGLKAVKMTMAHEGTHMQNFYRRAVKMGSDYAYADWLEEMTAMQMEDILSNGIDATYNPIRDVRLFDFYRLGSYNCNLLNFTGFGATCESYSVSGTFGGFLNRQLGLPFYKDLLSRATKDSKTVLGEAIAAARAGWTFDTAALNWKVSTTSPIPLGLVPTGFGYPALTTGGYSLPAIDPSAQTYATVRKQPLPVTLLQPYGSYVAPRSAVNGVYSDKVRVPAGASLSVVVY